MDILFTDFLPHKERSARLVKNAFGADEPINLPETHWKHFDWLASIGADMNQFTMECDINRHDNPMYQTTLSRYIGSMLVQDEARRHRAGDDVPLHINPHRQV